MPYSIEISNTAYRDLKKLPKMVRDSIGKVIDSLAFHPRPDGCVKMAAMQDMWRIRVGDYRIIYSIQDDRLVVLIVKIGHRREVYR
ncbi:MAG: type II toxin-antitoxin system RelE/ParE family toxin [Magnetococcales bacterium]|nr:type II toxin-antitoxin system RelE/ParE family toxin [Magnetococcales bacterium]